MQLFNKLSAQARSLLIEKSNQKRLNISFYQYHHIGNPQVLRDHLFLAWDKLDILGRTYVAREGINAQISIPSAHFEDFKTHLSTITFLKNVHLNMAIDHSDLSFLKLKIKVKNKIVADGLEDDAFDVTDKGKHLDALAFNKLLEHPNSICVDMRNHYESEIGHFEGTVRPDADTFRDSLPMVEKELENYKEDKNLLLYCTGGIRCEKASAYFKHKGFKHVFQLKGGIILYALQVKEYGLENKFKGKNFVFDHRKSERISEDIIANCHQCETPCDTHVNCANEACHLLFIQCDRCGNKMDQCCSDACKEIHTLPFSKQKILRKRKFNSNKIFKKGRSEILRFKK